MALVQSLQFSQSTSSAVASLDFHDLWGDQSGQWDGIMNPHSQDEGSESSRNLS